MSRVISFVIPGEYVLREWDGSIEYGGEEKRFISTGPL